MKAAFKKLIPERFPLRILWHKGKSFAVALFYRLPARQLTVIGITGTDGKTTSVGMIAHILQKTGRSVGAASTAFLQINDQRTENPTHLTSLSPFALQAFLKKLVEQRCTYAVIEMSSHGLVQGRTDWTFPSVAGITNTSPEHLDYHGSMEQYRRDKSILFTMLRGKGTKVLNEGDETCRMYSRIPSERTIVYGRNSGQIRIEGIRSERTSTEATLIAADGSKRTIRLPIPGDYNLDNAMLAIGCALAIGVPIDESVAALRDFAGIPGRLEEIDEGQNFSVYIDFAVSPKAYEQALTSLRNMTKQGARVLVLCSSCGNRMREKRPEIGRICSELADVVVVTEDETYGEDPHTVLEEVWAGVDPSKAEAHKIFDRKEAITFLFRNAKPGDAVVLCGMGPFSTFTKLEGRIPWDEREIARKILRAL